MTRPSAEDSIRLGSVSYTHLYNADSAEDLRRTHEPFFRIVRERHPDLPILLISKPNVDFDREESDRRRAVILDTYRRAKNRGDRRVYFIDGADLFGENDRDGCTVDGLSLIHI